MPITIKHWRGEDTCYERDRFAAFLAQTLLLPVPLAASVAAAIERELSPDGAEVVIGAQELVQLGTRRAVGAIIDRGAG